MNSPLPLIIVGGGLAGTLAALALARARPEQPLLLLEAGAGFGGNHTWSFFDSDIRSDERDWVAALHPWHSAVHQVRFADYIRVIAQGYNSVASTALDALVRTRLDPAMWRCDCPVARLAAEQVVLADGTVIAASAVIDARGPAGRMAGLELGWQKFVGLEYAVDPARTAGLLDRATIMDGTVRQIDGYRFVYTLPLAADRVLVEDTYYSNGPALDIPSLTTRVRAAAAERGIVGEELRHEHGVLPLVIAGRPELFWPSADPVARLGMRGGFFQATTGYSFPWALRLALGLARQRDLSAPAIAAWTREQFIAHWQRSGYYRLLNQMMFRAADPLERRAIFARFYRLPEPLIARFYRGELTLADKARLVIGRPPVPIGAAIRALCQPAAVA